jgi:hypothetical protein
MPLALAVLSVLALWSFLTVLAFGLMLTRHALESVRAHLEHFLPIVLGVETQVKSFGVLAIEFGQELTSTADQLAPLGSALASIDRGLTALQRTRPR